jgi:GxxExxY protein
MYSENELAKKVVDICFKIHTMYGPGLFESVYEEIFCYEWNKIQFPMQGNVESKLSTKKSTWALDLSRI